MTITCLSEVPIPDNAVIVFDLDDTLSPERNYVTSAYGEMAQSLGRPDLAEQMKAWFDSGESDVIGKAISEAGTGDKETLLKIYREHQPDLQLKPAIREMLDRLKSTGHPMGLITDGRSFTQRNKIRALELETWIDEIVISEEFGSGKPDLRNFQVFEQKYPGREFLYIGDNPKKDFLAPNQLGWLSVCVLATADNIHPQIFDDWGADHQPKFKIQTLA